MKYAISTNENQVLFTNEKGKTVGFDFVAPISESEALATLKHEIKARGNATQGCLSLMVNILDTPRLDEYKGKTPANEGLTKEFKSAVREIEAEYLKPLFVQPLEAKGNTPATIQKQWSAFIEELRSGGVWSNVGSTVRQYFAITGKLPCLYVGGNPQKNKLLSVDAMLKEIANLRQASDTTDKGISAKILELLDMVENRTEKTNLGNAGAALAALEKLTNAYRAIEAYEREQAMAEYQKKADAKGMDTSTMEPAASEPKPNGVQATADKAISKAQGKKNKGQVSPKSTTPVEVAPL